MKKRYLPIFMGILSITILLSFTFFSCSAPGSTTNPGTNNGSLAISINDSVSADTAPAVGGPEEDIFPVISMNPASYHIAGIGPNGATFEETTTGNSLVVNALAFGDWTLTITALNSDGTSIGVGSSTTTVQSNTTSMVNVIVRPYDGLGTLDLSLAWTAGDVNTPQVVSTLQPNAGLTRTLDFTVAGASATFSASDVPTGYHTLVLKLLDNGILTMGAVDVVRIVADNTTSGSFLFDKINMATGTIEVGITPEMGDPLTVEIAGGADTKPENQSMSLTASVTNYADNVNYVWYVNGDSVDTGAIFDFDETWALGYYNINVTAYNTDGSRAGSEGVFVEIGEDVVLIPVVQVASSETYTMIVKADGSLWATGSNGNGRSGNGSNPDSTVPVQILSSGVQSVSVGKAHTMIVKTDGSLWVCGWNYHGQYGDGTDYYESRIPIMIMSSGVQAVSCGSEYSMILKTDGSLWATGNNNYGQLGIGSATRTLVPIEVMSSGVQAVSSGIYHTVVLKTDGSLWATGRNNYGQLGRGEDNFPSDVFIEILSDGVQKISVGGRHTMIIKNDGSLWTMGCNIYGQVGNGANAGIHSYSPVMIVNEGVENVSGGEAHTLFTKTDGSLWAFGRNQYGQLGIDSNNSDVRVPVEILSGEVLNVSGGEYYSMFIKSDGSLWAVGNNDFGQLGIGSTEDTLSLTQVEF